MNASPFFFFRAWKGAYFVGAGADDFKDMVESADDFKDMVESAVGEAGGDDVGAGKSVSMGEAGAETEQPTGGAAEEQEQSAPAADTWKPPSREEWEAAQKHLEIGRRFAPYANDIDGILRERLRGPAHVQQAAPAAKPPEPNEVDDLLGPKYADTLQALGTDGKVWDRIFRGLNKRVNGEEIAGLKKALDEVKAHLADVQAYNELIAPRRFAETPDWKQSGKDYVGLLTDGLRDPQKAWEIARANAVKKGATPTQAAAAGDRAAAKVEAANEQAQAAPATKGKPLTGKRPVPANDKSLQAGGRKPTGSSEKLPSYDKRERAGKWEERLVLNALNKLGVS